MAWARVQSAGASIGSGTTTGSATFTTANLTAGTKLIAAVCVTGNTRATTGVSDGTSSFTEIAHILAGTAGEVSLWALDTPAGDAGTKPAITASFTASSSGAGIVIQEVSGLLAGNTTAMTDGTAGTLAGAGGASTGSPSYSSTAVSEYLVAVYGDMSNLGTETYGDPAGYTADAANINANANAGIALDYKNSANGTEAGSYARNSGTGNAWGVILAAFKIAASGTSASAAVAAAAGVPPPPADAVTIGMTIRGS